MKTTHHYHKTYLIALLVSVCLTFTEISAQTVNPLSTLQLYNQADISFSILGLHYVEKEDFLPSRDILDKETGLLPGMTLAIRHMVMPHLMLGAHLSFHRGSTTYKGSLQGPEIKEAIPITSRSHNAITHLSIQLGWPLLIARSILTPHLEVGFRSWERRLLAVEVVDDYGINGYKETYTHGELMLGLQTARALTKHLFIRLSGAIGSTINPKMQSDIPYLLENDEGVSTISSTFKLGEQLIGYAKAFLYYPLSEYSYGHVGISYQHFSYGSSQLNSLNFLEPSSKTDRILLSIGISLI